MRPEHILAVLIWISCSKPASEAKATYNGESEWAETGSSESRDYFNSIFGRRIDASVAFSSMPECAVACRQEGRKCVWYRGSALCARACNGNFDCPDDGICFCSTSECSFWVAGADVDLDQVNVCLVPHEVVIPGGR